MISVLGVPGYAEAYLTPASHAPSAMASLPESNRFITVLLEDMIERGLSLWEGFAAG
jgi:hypothetical protein